MTGKKQNTLSNFNSESVGNKYSEFIDQAPSEISKVYADEHDTTEDIYDEEKDDNVIVIHEHHHHHHHKNVTEDSMNDNDDEFLPAPNRFQQRNDKFVADEQSYFHDDDRSIGSEYQATPDVFNDGVLDHFLNQFFLS